MGSSLSLKAVGFPHISKMPRQAVRSSDHEEVRRIRHEFQNAWDADQRDYEQCITAWKMYFGYPGEQWERDALRYKENHKQRAAQYNIIKPKVNIFHGSLMADEYDFKYNPIDRRRTTAIQALENAYYCDKEECNYDHHYGLTLLDGCVHVGVLEEAVTTRHDPRGNICFLRRDPTRIRFDPYWVTDDDEDCMRCWKDGHMTARMLKAKYENLPTSSKFEEELKKVERQGMKWQERGMDDYGTAFPSIEHAFHVIEYHWIEEIHKKRIIALDSRGMWVPFPVTEDAELLQLFAEKIGVQDWENGAEVVPYTDRIHWSSTICFELFPYSFIERGKPEIQIQRLPFFQFTTSRDPAGRNMGMVAPLTDPQLDYNYARSKILDLLAMQQGGAIIFNKDRLPDDGDQQDFERNHNDVGRAFGLRGEVKGFMDHVSNAQASPELIRETVAAFDVSDRVVNVPAAMQAETQSANEPAALFAMKLRQSKIGTKTVDDRVRYLREQMALGYFNQARITYAGAERVFTSKDGKREAVFNRVLPDGSILNRIDVIPKCSVSIEEAPNNMTRQMRERTDIAAILQAIPEGYREHVAILLGSLMKTTDLHQSLKDDIDEATEIERVKARIASIAEITGAFANQKASEATILQIQQQIDQLVEAMRSRAMPQGAAPPEGQLPEAVSPAEVPLQEGPPVEAPAVPEQLAPTPGAEGPGVGQAPAATEGSPLGG